VLHSSSRRKPEERATDLILASYPAVDRHLAVLNEIKLELQAQRRAEPSSANGTKSEPSTPTAEIPVVVRASGPVGGKKGLGGMRKQGSGESVASSLISLLLSGLGLTTLSSILYNSVVRIQTRKYSSHTSASLESAVERGTSDRELLFPLSLSLSLSPQDSQDEVLTLNPTLSFTTYPDLAFPAALHLRDLFKSASSPDEFENAVKFLGSNHASLGRNELCFNAFLGTQ